MDQKLNPKDANHFFKEASIDFEKKELHDIYSSLQYTRLEIGFESKSEEELYDRLTKLMDKVAKLRQVCDCQENVSE